MASERILFDSALVRIGHFACAAHEPEWQVDNVIRGNTAVFPTVPVRIHHDDKDPVVADRNVVMYYNEGQVYRRGLLHARGDEAVWIALKADLWASLLAEADPRAADRPERPFTSDHGPSPSACYLRHRALAEVLLAGREPDSLQVEECAISLAGQLVRADAGARGLRAPRDGRATARTHVRAAEEVRELLATAPGEPWTLERIVERVAVSPSHLCRVFKGVTGQTIHAYLTQLRLREAADAVVAGERDLTGLALRVGFSTHSHFTDAFRRAFGEAPSRLRRSEALRRIAASTAAA